MKYQRGANHRKTSFAYSWRIVVILPLLVFGLLSDSASGQSTKEQKSCLCGLVLDGNGAAIERATVRDLLSGIEIETDRGGSFRFVGDAPSVEVVVRARGFREARVRLFGEEPTEVILEAATVVESVSVTGNDSPGSPAALLRIPGSYQSLEPTQLENARVFNFSEALRKFSGVVIRDEEGFGLRPNIGIRGTNPTRSTKVLLLEDGVPLAYAPYGDNSSYYHPPIERFESVEVLKGSGQIEYGPVTVGGVINYLTPNPTDETKFSIKTIVGNRDFFNGNAKLSGTDFGVGYIVNFNRKQGEGARDNIRSGVNDLSVKLNRVFGSRHQLSGKFSVLDEDSRVTYSGLTLAEYTLDPRGNPFRNDSFEGSRYGLSATHSASWNSRLSSSTVFYYNRFLRDWWRQSSNSLQRPNRISTDSDCLSMSDLNTTCGNEGRLRSYRTLGIEPRFMTDFTSGVARHEIKFGFRAHSEIQDRRQVNGDSPLSRSGSISESNYRRNDALSGFVHHRLIVGRLAVVSGLRIEGIAYKRTNRMSGASGKTRLTQLIPGIGITFNPTGKMTIFAGVHRGFAPPRTEDIIGNAGGVVDLDSERSWNFEAGARMKPVEAVSMDVSWFRTNYENQIVAASIAGGVGSVFTNGGRTSHQGLEISGRFDSIRMFDFGHNIFISVNYANLWDAKFVGRRFSSVSGFASIPVSGNRLPYAPEQTLNLGVGFEYRNLDLLLENNSISRQFADDMNTIDSSLDGQRGALPGQTYWNATVNYRIERYKSTLFATVKNLFDRTFLIDRSRGMVPSSPRLLQIGLKISL